MCLPMIFCIFDAFLRQITAHNEIKKNNPKIISQCPSVVAYLL